MVAGAVNLALCPVAVVGVVAWGFAVDGLRGHDGRLFVRMSWATMATNAAPRTVRVMAALIAEPR